MIPMSFFQEVSKNISLKNLQSDVINLIHFWRLGNGFIKVGLCMNYSSRSFYITVL